MHLKDREPIGFFIGPARGGLSGGDLVGRAAGGPRAKIWGADVVPLLRKGGHKKGNWGGGGGLFWKNFLGCVPVPKRGAGLESGPTGPKRAKALWPAKNSAQWLDQNGESGARFEFNLPRGPRGNPCLGRDLLNSAQGIRPGPKGWGDKRAKEGAVRKRAFWGVPKGIIFSVEYGRFFIFREFEIMSVFVWQGGRDTYSSQSGTGTRLPGGNGSSAHFLVTKTPISGLGDQKKRRMKNRENEGERLFQILRGKRRPILISFAFFDQFRWAGVPFGNGRWRGRGGISAWVLKGSHPA